MGNLIVGIAGIATALLCINDIPLYLFILGMLVGIINLYAGLNKLGVGDE